MILTLATLADGVFVDADVIPQLKNPADSYGLVRTDTNELLVDSQTPYSRDGEGSYFYDLMTPGDATPDTRYRRYSFITFGARNYFISSVRNDSFLVFGKYCNSNDVILKFGQDNVATWLAIDDADYYIDSALRCAEFIKLAEAQVLDSLRGGHIDESFLEPNGQVAPTIRSIAADFAGVRMYEARGVTEFDAESGRPQHRLQYQQKNAEKLLSRLKEGLLRVNVTERNSVPHFNV